MKKLYKVSKYFIITFSLVLLTGCYSDQQQYDNNDNSLCEFTQIGYDYVGTVFYHNKTKVMYVLGHGSGGSLTVMLDENGKPLTYNH